MTLPSGKRFEPVAAVVPARHNPIERAFDGLPDALLVFDGAVTLVGCNRAARRVLGIGGTAGLEGDFGSLLAMSDQFDAVDRRALGAAVRTQIVGGAAEIAVECSKARVLRLAAVRMDDGWIVSLRTEAAEARRACGPGAVDGLTGLLNRAAFRECLADAEIETRAKTLAVSLLFLDLDRFKQVNDTLGHPVGDLLLARAAERMRKAVRAEDVVGRIGGDEFAVLTRTGSDESIARLAARLIDLVSRPYLIEGHLISVGVSIGAAFMPVDAQTADQLAKCADLALYRAKADGRGVLRHYLPEMSENAAARRLLEFDLRKALLLGEFELHYQPQLEVDGNRITGFEALLRWNHPVRGRVSPAEFVPLAEETGQIVAIGAWVMRTAAQEAATWPQDVSVSVNLSPVQFRSGKLVATVAAVLAATGLAPHRLELEITEGVLLNDEAANIAILTEIHALGVKIAIDDFGTGYASLAYLKRFAFDTIKIDQSFVREMIHNADSDAIVQAIVGLGRRLGIATIAEGVETADELDRVRAHGCGAVQGYLTGRPLDRTALRALLAERAAQSPRRA